MCTHTSVGNEGGCGAPDKYVCNDCCREVVPKKTGGFKLKPSPLEGAAVCLDCRWKGRVGELMARDTLRCPKCDSANWHPAGREAITVPEYVGEIGTRN